MFFNIFVGNNDSHAKNLSIYSPAGGGVRLTPFYDLMCTRIYPGLSQSFAFDMGGTTLPGEIKRDNIVRMAEILNFQPKFVLQIGQDVARKMPPALAAALTSLHGGLHKGDVTMAGRLTRYIEKTAQQASKRMLT